MMVEEETTTTTTVVYIILNMGEKWNMQLKGDYDNRR